eukprot:SAG31_NODE_3805_length_3866_cov_2.814972_1_plen_274_part_00
MRFRERPLAGAAFCIGILLSEWAKSAGSAEDVRSSSPTNLAMTRSLFDSYDHDGSGQLEAQEAASALPRLIQERARKDAGWSSAMHHPTRSWWDPVVASNVLFYFAGGLWWVRGYRVQSLLLALCGTASVAYHTSGEPSPSVRLEIDSTAVRQRDRLGTALQQCLAFAFILLALQAKLTFLHTLILARKMRGSNEDWLSLAALIAAALLVYVRACPLRWQPEYVFWHTWWHTLVFAGQIFLCLSLEQMPGARADGSSAVKQLETSASAGSAHV